jgi:hypothetical protein
MSGGFYDEKVNNNSNKLCSHIEEQEVRTREQVQRTSENVRRRAKRAQMTEEFLQRTS